MLIFELKKSRSRQTQAQSVSLPTDKASVLARHIERLQFKEGDPVVFKKPKKSRVRGILTHIERDPTKVTWTKGGGTPNYLTVRVETKEGKHTSVYTLKTCENKLVKDTKNA